MRARPPDSHSQKHILPSPLRTSSSPASLVSWSCRARRIDWVCLVDYSCVTPATKTHENAIGGPFWSDTWSRNSAEPCKVYPSMSHREQKSSESVAGGPFLEDTCHKNAAEPCQVYPSVSHRERKSTESVAGGPSGSDTWHRNTAEP